MSQLNLKKILSSDDISTLVDTINYNFSQILTNGGGPMGLTGLIGAPGLPGLQGLQGEIGVTGPDGTYIFTSTVDPSVYPWGASGENLPRVDDIYVQVNIDSIVILQKHDGLSDQNWVIIGTVTSLAGMTQIIHDNIWGTLTGPDKASFANDPTLAGKTFFGDINSFGPTAGILDPSDSTKFSSSYSLVDTLGLGPNVLTISGDKNQLRILGSSSDMNLSGNSGLIFFHYGGGVIHSIEKYASTTGTSQLYRVENGDLYGNKWFSFRLNSIGNYLMIGNTANNMCIGGSGLGENLVARLSVQKTMAVGDSSFYTNAVFYGNNGLVSQGNLAVGSNNNVLATGGFYATNGNTSNVIIDANSSAVLGTAQSNISLSLDKNNLKSNSAYTFIHDGYSSGNYYDSLRINFSKKRFTSTVETTHMTLKYAGGTPFGFTGITPVYPQIGIGNTDPSSLLEVGQSVNRISIGGLSGDSSTSYMSSYLGFNLHRLQNTTSLVRKGDSIDNGGSAVWTNLNGNLNISLVSSTSGVTASMTYTDLYDYTRLCIHPQGSLVISEQNASTCPTYINGLIVDVGATGDISNFYDPYGRKITAVFGGGLRGSRNGSPMICDTNGLNQASLIKPQFTFWNDDLYGMWLGVGNTANGDSGQRIGLAAGGNSTLTVTPDRVGIGQYNPSEILHIGEMTTFHDGSTKFLGFNTTYDNSLLANRRLISVGDGNISHTTRYPAAWLGYTSLTQPTSIPSQNGVSDQYGSILSLNVCRTGTFSDSLSITDPNFINVESSMKVYSPVTFELGTSNAWTTTNAPKVTIGLSNLKDDITPYGDVLLKRGTLSIASQCVQDSADVFRDLYVLSYYDYQGGPHSGIITLPSTFNSIGRRILSHTFMSTKQGAISDLPWMTVTSPECDNTGTFVSNDNRTVNFGANYRVGIGVDVPVIQTSINAALQVNKIGICPDAATFTGNVRITNSDDYNTGDYASGWIIPDNVHHFASRDGITYYNIEVYGAVHPDTLLKFKVIGKTIFVNFYLNIGPNTWGGVAPTNWKYSRTQFYQNANTPLLLNSAYSQTSVGWTNNKIAFVTNLEANSTVDINKITIDILWPSTVLASPADVDLRLSGQFIGELQ